MDHEGFRLLNRQMMVSFLQPSCSCRFAITMTIVILSDQVSPWHGTNKNMQGRMKWLHRHDKEGGQ
jgi:hypothetical protein